jgi:hypothetical protein
MSNAAQQREHKQWLARMAKEADKERLRRARAAVKDARQQKRGARGRARKACSEARKRVRQWARDERVRVRLEVKELRESVRTRIAAAELEAKSTCSAGLADADSRARAAKTAAERLAAEREARRLERNWKGKGTHRPTKREVREESDDDVRNNVGEDEAIIFDKVRARIKTTARMSRTEAFTHWLHDHPADAQRILEAHHEQDVERLVREEEKQRRAMGVAYRRESDEELSRRISLAAVPF